MAQFAITHTDHTGKTYQIVDVIEAATAEDALDTHYRWSGLPSYLFVGPPQSHALKSASDLAIEALRYNTDCDWSDEIASIEAGSPNALAAIAVRGAERTYDLIGVISDIRPASKEDLNDVVENYVEFHFADEDVQYPAATVLRYFTGADVPA